MRLTHTDTYVYYIYIYTHTHTPHLHRYWSYKTDYKNRKEWQCRTWNEGEAPTEKALAAAQDAPGHVDIFRGWIAIEAGIYIYYIPVCTPALIHLHLHLHLHVRVCVFLWLCTCVWMCVCGLFLFLYIKFMETWRLYTCLISPSPHGFGKDTLDQASIVAKSMMAQYESLAMEKVFFIILIF